MQTILQTKNLCKYYGKNENEIKAVDHTNITVEQGEFVAVVGKSGSGKSTLLHLLGGRGSIQPDAHLPHVQGGRKDTVWHLCLLSGRIFL